MYGIALGSRECPVFYGDGDSQRSKFGLEEIKTIINSLLGKKARNNGVGRHLLSSLRIQKTCRHDFSTITGSLGFFSQALNNGTYSITLFGDYPHELLDRLNRCGSQARAIARTKRLRDARKWKRSLGKYHEPVRQQIPRALPGSGDSLKRHFRHSEITLSQAITAIARATEFDQRWVRRRLYRSLDERSVASIRLPGGFVFRVDLLRCYRGLLDLSAPVEIRTTKDNTHKAYRRLRNASRKLLQHEQKLRAAGAIQFAAWQRDRRLYEKNYA